MAKMMMMMMICDEWVRLTEAASERERERNGRDRNIKRIVNAEN